MRDARARSWRWRPISRVQLASAGLTGVKFLQLDFFDVADNPPPVLPFPVAGELHPGGLLDDEEHRGLADAHDDRMPEIADQMAGILTKVDGILGELDGKKIPDQLAATARQRQPHAGRGAAQDRSGGHRQALQGGRAVARRASTRRWARMNKLLAHVDGEKGLLSSVVRASDAFGDTVRGADGLGGQLEEALQRRAGGCPVNPQARRRPREGSGHAPEGQGPRRGEEPMTTRRAPALPALLLCGASALFAAGCALTSKSEPIVPHYYSPERPRRRRPSLRQVSRPRPRSCGSVA